MSRVLRVLPQVMSRLTPAVRCQWSVATRSVPTTLVEGLISGTWMGGLITDDSPIRKPRFAISPDLLTQQGPSSRVRIARLYSHQA